MLFSVCSFQRLHGPNGEPCVEHGAARQRRASRNPRPVYLLHEEPRNQTQPRTAPLHTAWTYTPPHTDLRPSSWLLRTDSMQQPLGVSRELSTSCLFGVNRRQNARKWMKTCAVPFQWLLEQYCFVLCLICFFCILSSRGAEPIFQDLLAKAFQAMTVWQQVGQKSPCRGENLCLSFFFFLRLRSNKLDLLVSHWCGLIQWYFLGTRFHIEQVFTLGDDF